MEAKFIVGHKLKYYCVSIIIKIQILWKLMTVTEKEIYKKLN